MRKLIQAFRPQIRSSMAAFQRPGTTGADFVAKKCTKQILRPPFSENPTVRDVFKYEYLMYFELIKFSLIIPTGMVWLTGRGANAKYISVFEVLRCVKLKISQTRLNKNVKSLSHKTCVSRAVFGEGGPFISGVIAIKWRRKKSIRRTP